MPSKKRPASAVPSAVRLPWQAAAVEVWPLERILPYTNNARTHSAADIDALRARLAKLGETFTETLEVIARQWKGTGVAMRAPRRVPR